MLIPNRALSGKDLIKYADILNIPYFRGVFMRDRLPLRVRRNESAIVNLDSQLGSGGTHWVCYIKRNNFVQYFDSFGNLRPPAELVRYWKVSDIRYNYKRLQNKSSVNCGHLCLRFLSAHTLPHNVFFDRNAV